MPRESRHGASLRDLGGMLESSGFPSAGKRGTISLQEEEAWFLVAKEKSTKYSVSTDSWSLSESCVSDAQLEKWATDPNCIQKETCADALAKRLAKRERDKAERQAARAAKREELQDNPFDPRTEISADARHIAGRIVTHLWILFVLLPVIIGILLALAGVIK
jgi:hypothetical protein